MNNISDSLLILDANLKVIFVNSSFYKTYNTSPQTTLGSFIYDINDKQWNIPNLRQLIETILSEKKVTKDLIVEHNFPDIGKTSTSEISLTSDKIKYILIVIKDNTEKKRLDDEKNSYLSVAAHNLRTPVTVIKGYADMLLGGDFGKITEEIKGPLTEIIHTSNRMTRMINDFLTISRVEQGRLNIKIKKFDIVPLLKGISVQIRVLTKEKNLKLVLKKLPSSLHVWGNPDKISEVLFNLLDNAIKFTNEGSITINVNKENESVIISVSDTGEGISQDQQKNLFNKYFQIQSRQPISRGKEHGLGLGLYISRLIIESCGGKIWVESKLKVGSKFSFSLPVKNIKE